MSLSGLLGSEGDCGEGDWVKAAVPVAVATVSAASVMVDVVVVLRHVVVCAGGPRVGLAIGANVL